MKMYPRSEFPVTVLPAVVRLNGSVSRAAIAARFAACGCPLAKPEIAVALIKAGHEPREAIQLAMLAHYVGALSIDCIERTGEAILYSAQLRHAEKFPHGKCAEDQAARREHRPSRWGTAEFHKAGE